MEPPVERKGRKVLMVASGLIGALALGGAIAFAYKTGGVPQLASGEAPPLIQADSRASKSDAGRAGRQASFRIRTSRFTTGSKVISGPRSKDSSRDRKKWLRPRVLKAHSLILTLPNRRRSRLLSPR